MNKKGNRDTALKSLINDLQVFLELSFQEDETALSQWLRDTIDRLNIRCWEKQQCDDKECPAYDNQDGRCWLIAGTMCGGRPQGKFVDKYGFCTECEVYRDAIGNDPVLKLRELIIALIHSLRLKQQKLIESNAKVKVLSGFLPICSSCKKIRDDQGYWNQIESYIKEHSEAEFSHSICPACAQELYPELMKKLSEK